MHTPPRVALVLVYLFVCFFIVIEYLTKTVPAFGRDPKADGGWAMLGGGRLGPVMEAVDLGNMEMACPGWLGYIFGFWLVLIIRDGVLVRGVS